MADDSYVTNAAWLRIAGRVDHIDEVADQFERPAATAWPKSRAEFWGSSDFWGRLVHWPRAAGRPAA